SSSARANARLPQSDSRWNIQRLFRTRRACAQAVRRLSLEDCFAETGFSRLLVELVMALDGVGELLARRADALGVFGKLKRSLFGGKRALIIAPVAGADFAAG